MEKATVMHAHDTNQLWWWYRESLYRIYRRYKVIPRVGVARKIGLNWFTVLSCKDGIPYAELNLGLDFGG